MNNNEFDEVSFDDDECYDNLQAELSLEEVEENLLELQRAQADLDAGLDIELEVGFKLLAAKHGFRIK